MTSSLHNVSYFPQTSKSLSKSQQLASHLTEHAGIATKLSLRYEQLLRSEKYCDCQFTVGKSVINCHKLILAAASPVFEAMFYGPLKELQSKIEIDDISPEIFRVLVTYIYVGSINFEQLSLEESIELYYAAEKYLLNELVQDCLMAVASKLRFENILPALELSVCMDLMSLLDICMSFFTRCCLGDAQYMGYLKSNYRHHVSKECIKAIIAANKSLHNQLLWFVFEWCQRECHELGLQKTDCALIIDDLELERTEYVIGEDGNLVTEYDTTPPRCQTIERTYYKACRPFTIDYNGCTWKFSLKSNSFISLHGLTLQSRLMPTSTSPLGVASEYNENLIIEIRAGAAPANDSHSDESLVWRHVISKQPTKYNCDLNLCWKNGVVLSPDTVYEVKLIWSSDAYGAEYPCSLMSNVIEGIEFQDPYAYFGSLIKGLSFVKLI